MTTDNDRLKALKDFLRAELLLPPIIRHRPTCGSAMESLMVKFFTAEDDEVWDTPLPVCSNCVRPLGKQSFVN